MTGKEIMEFFDKQIDTKSFAMYLRKYNLTVATKELISINKTSEIMNLDPIIDGMYWTNEFADLIDPLVDSEGFVLK